MTLTIEPYLVTLAVLLIFSVIASKLSDRFGIPALLIFLAVGMLAGSDGLGGIYFDDPVMAQVIGIFALAVILFAGGLDTEWRAIRPVLKPGLSLATLGTLITAVILGTAAYLILDIPFLEGLLLGSIVSSTDAAAVFSILNAKGIHLQPQVKHTLELESGSNDPTAVFLTIGIIELITHPGMSPLTLIPLFVLQMVIGAAAGWLFAKVTLFFINRLKLGYEGLYPVLVLGAVLLTYGATALARGSGFLAVYILGIVMAREDFLHRRSLTRFYDGLAWLMQIVLFLTLGLLVFPTQVATIIGPGLALAAILILVARPVSVFLALALNRMAAREKAFIAWVGLRGAVPIVLATYPRLAGIESSGLIFNIVFFVVLTSVLIQGTSLPVMARWLKVEAEGKPESGMLADIERRGWSTSLRETLVEAGWWAVGKAVYELGLPQEYLIVLIRRGGQFLIPNGGVVLQAGDQMLGLSSALTHDQVLDRLKKGEGAAL